MSGGESDDQREAVGDGVGVDVSHTLAVAHAVTATNPARAPVK